MSIRFPNANNQTYQYKIDTAAVATGTSYFEGGPNIGTINKLVLNTTAQPLVNIQQLLSTLNKYTYKTISLILPVKPQYGSSTDSQQLTFTFNILNISFINNTVDLFLASDETFKQWQLDTNINTYSLYFTGSFKLETIPENLLEVPLLFLSTESPVVTPGYVYLDTSQKILYISTQTADIKQIYRNIDITNFYRNLSNLSTFGLQVQYKRHDIQYTFDISSVVFDSINSKINISYRTDHVSINKRDPLYTTKEDICIVFAYNSKNYNLYNTSLYTLWSATGASEPRNNFNTTFDHSFTGSAINGYINNTSITGPSGVPLYPVSVGATGTVLNIYSRYAPDITDMYLTNTILQQTATGVYGYNTLKEFVNVLNSQENLGQLNIKFSPTTTPTSLKQFNNDYTNSILIYDIISAETGLLGVEERIRLGVSYNSRYNFEPIIPSLPATGYCEVFFIPYSDTNSYTTNTVVKNSVDISRMSGILPNTYTNTSSVNDNTIQTRNNFNNLLGYNMSQTLITSNPNSSINSSNVSAQLKKYN